MIDKADNCLRQRTRLELECVIAFQRNRLDFTLPLEERQELESQLRDAKTELRILFRQGRDEHSLSKGVSEVPDPLQLRGNVGSLCRLLGLNSEKELEQVLNEPHDTEAVESMQSADEFWNQIEQDAMEQEQYHNSESPEVHELPETPTSMPTLIPALAVLGLLLLSFADLPYAFFTLLRVATCAACVYYGFQCWQKVHVAWIWILSVFGCLYNPLAPIRMHRDDWKVINLVTLVVFGALISVLFWNSRKCSAK